MSTNSNKTTNSIVPSQSQKKEPKEETRIHVYRISDRKEYDRKGKIVIMLDDYFPNVLSRIIGEYTKDIFYETTTEYLMDHPEKKAYFYEDNNNRSLPFRPGMGRMLSDIKCNDTIVIPDLDCIITDEMLDILSFIEKIKKKECQLIILTYSRDPLILDSHSTEMYILSYYGMYQAIRQSNRKIVHIDEQ